MRLAFAAGALIAALGSSTVFAQAPQRTIVGSLERGVSGGGTEVTAGVGLGANALLGGCNQTVVLQPINVQAQTGLNVAAGIAGITLEASR